MIHKILLLAILIVAVFVCATGAEKDDGYSAVGGFFIAVWDVWLLFL